MGVVVCWDSSWWVVVGKVWIDDGGGVEVERGGCADGGLDELDVLT